ncbi:MAG TPA: MFS transporter [Rhizomicrobium sp.]|nr:MFS transporter [Rhizomicrobium sp.]
MNSERRELTLPQLAAVVAGNGLEFYDFLIFGFFAVQIGQCFFPGHDATGSLLLTLATFGVGFVTRPLGGAVIGSLGDRIGRKPAMLFCFGLMGFSILGLVLTPSHASIGIAAPILVVLFRLLQGFALGGEVGPATAFLMEAATPARRGLYVSLQFATQQAAILTAGLVGVLLSNLLSAQELTDWGWRAAMALGLLVVPFALILRRRLPETLDHKSETTFPRPSREQVRIGFFAILTLAAATVATYTMNYMNIFGSHTLGLPSAQAFGAVVVAGSCGVIFNPVGGWLSDRLGRKPVMMGAYGLLGLVALPCFVMMAHFRSAPALYAGAAIMATLLALGTPAVMASLTESLPPQMRSGGTGIIYALAISLFGGTANFIVAWLTALTGSPLAPAVYLCLILAIGWCAMLMVRETAPARRVRAG